MSRAIQTFDLTKRFPLSRGWRDLFSIKPAPRPAVDGVNLEVHEGELFGLVGPNGAGKTTLIKLLCTLIVPTSGTARIGGHDLRDEQAIKRTIGLMTSDERSFYWRLSGRQNLEFFATLQGIPAEHIRQRVDAVLDEVGLTEFADGHFRTYSTGMRQRLSIARALLHEPRILFLDEPMKGLDPNGTRQLHALIRERLSRQRGITVFFTTHRLAEAERLCDRVAIMQRGRIRACGTLKELRELLRLVDRYQMRVQGFPSGLQDKLGQQIPHLQIATLNDQLLELQFETRDGDTTLNQILDQVRAQGGQIRSLTREPASLDTIFSRVTETDGAGEAHGKSYPSQLAAKGQTGEVVTQLSAQQLPRMQEDGEDESAHPVSSPSTVANKRPGMWKHLVLKLRVALAFLQRDLQSERSYRFAFALQLSGMFASVVMFYFIAQLLGEAATPYLQAYGGDYFSFVLIGIAFAGYFSVSLSGFSSKLRQAQTTGTLEAMLATPTGVSTIVLCSSLWNYVMTSFRVLIYLLLGVLFLGVHLGDGNYALALLILVLTVVSFSSLGILAASFIMVLKRGDPVTWVFNSLFGLLGGVYYPIAILPEWLQPISYLLPVTYALEAMRMALLQGATLASVATEILALLLFGLLLLPISLVAFRYAVRRARIDGSLTHY